MVRSMTGFGRYEVVRNSRKLTIEMKSVNHKYLDVNIKLPRLLNMFETGMRGILKEYAVRGKIDIVVSYEDMSGTDEQLKFNKKIAQEYMRYFKVMEEELGLRNDITVSSLSRYPDVLTMEDVQINEAEIWELMEETMKGACEKLAEARRKESENLKADL